MKLESELEIRLEFTAQSLECPRLEIVFKKSLPPPFRPLPSALPMPKSIARRKTKKSAAKRFKITGTGKIMSRKAGLRHLASSKSSKRKRKLGKDGQVDKTMVPRMRELMPFA